MKFVKENIFLLATALVLLAGSSAIYVFGSSANSAADKAGEDRKALAGNMARLYAKPVNAKLVESLKDQTDAVQAAAQKVVDFCEERSSHYDVIVLKPSENQQVPAFPIDAKMYQDESLGVLFPKQYVKEMHELLTILKPASCPTPEDLHNEALRFASRDTPIAAPGMPAPAIAPAPEMEDRDPGMMGGRLRIGGGRLREFGGGPARSATPTLQAQPTSASTRPVEDTPEIKAQRNLIWNSSRQGWIYADEKSLYIPMTDTGASKEYEESELWMAQVGMWVQQEILQAIQKTNEEAQKANASEEIQGVAASAIKRLVNINFRGYCMKAGSGGVASGGAAASTGPKMSYLRVASMTRGADQPPTLTGHVTCPAYDVLHYDFTVVMPTRYLRDLYRNLRLQNFHSVLDVQIWPVSDASVTGGSNMGMGMGFSSASTNLPVFYYGTDAVSQVTIVGELLIMSDASRGHKDPKTGNWDRPPLMPKSILTLMKTADASALRPEDTARATGGAVAGTGGAPAAGGPRPSAGRAAVPRND